MTSQLDPRKTRRRERLFNIPVIVIALTMLCFLAYVIPVRFLSEEQQNAFVVSFGFVPILFATSHDLMTQLSAVTYSFLHGSWTHLALNMVWFIIFGSPLAERIGAFFFFLFWIFTAYVAALTHFSLYPESAAVLVGASGAVSGLMGGAARYDFQHVSDRYAGGRPGFSGPIMPVSVALRSRTVLVFMGGWLLLNLLTGAMSQILADEAGGVIAWEAHIGGLIAGFLTAGFFDRRSSSSGSAKKADDN